MSAFVVHCRKVGFDVYIGRPSKWGNPYVIGRDGTREEVIAKFREHVARNPSLERAVREELQGKILGCYCAPQSCHGDVLAAIANAPVTEEA